MTSTTFKVAVNQNYALGNELFSLHTLFYILLFSKCLQGQDYFSISKI